MIGGFEFNALSFGLGFFAGGFVGVLVMALAFMASASDDDEDLISEVEPT